MVNANTLTDLSAHFSQVRHQVKNDMSVIIGFAQLLEVEIKKSCGESEYTDTLLQKLRTIDQRAKKVVREIDVNLADPSEA